MNTIIIILNMICTSLPGTNKGADQPLHPGSLISTLIIRFLRSILA